MTLQRDVSQTITHPVHLRMCTAHTAWIFSPQEVRLPDINLAITIASVTSLDRVRYVMKLVQQVWLRIRTNDRPLAFILVSE